LIVQRVNGGVFNKPEPAMNTQNTNLHRLPLIHNTIEALQQPAVNHFEHGPDAIYRGHVGNLGRGVS
jgi:hypothetical protein